MKARLQVSGVRSVLALLGCWVMGIPALGFIIVEQEVPVPAVERRVSNTHFPRPIHRHAPLELRSQKIDVAIEDQVASTTIDEVYYNPTSRRLEGTFLFPLPEGANIRDFAMDVNGELVAAELLDADKARGIYMDIVRQVKDPALMEYAGQALLKVRIFPLEPRKEKRVHLKYTQVLERDGDLIDYTFPSNTGKYCSQPIGDFSLKAEIKTKHLLKTFYSPSHEIEVRRKGERKAVAGFEASDFAPDSNIQLFFSTESDDGEPVSMDLLTHAGEERGEGYFMLFLNPSGWDDDRIVEKDVVFALDTSGSMAGDKMRQAKAALEFCLENLNPGDRFDVVRYSTEAEPLFGKLKPFNRENRSEALEFVGSLKAVGGTAIDAAVQKSVGYVGDKREAGRPYQVIFLTDGRPTIGISDPRQIVRRLEDKLDGVKTPVRVFCFGIGTKVNTKLLDLMSEKTRAATEYVLPQEDIEIKVSRLYSKITDPVLADLSLEFTGGVRVSKVYPKDLPDLFKGEQLVVLGQYERRDGGGRPRVVLEGSAHGERHEFAYDARFPKRNPKNDFVPRLWASRRVGYLLDEMRLYGDNDELRDEVVTLARQYGIVTPYTSYLIVEDEQVRDLTTAARSIRLRSVGRGEPAEMAAAARYGLLPELQAGRRLSEAEALAGGGGAFRGAAPRPGADRFDVVALQKDSTGVAAVAGAKANARLKHADKLGAAAAASNDAYFAFGIQVEDGAEMLQQRIQTVAGKTFYQNGETWIDSEVQSKAKSKAKTVTIEFNSPDYFALFERQPSMVKWLALGKTLRLVVGDVVYEIVEPASEPDPIR